VITKRNIYKYDSFIVPMDKITRGLLGAGTIVASTVAAIAGIDLTSYYLGVGKIPVFDRNIGGEGIRMETYAHLIPFLPEQRILIEEKSDGREIVYKDLRKGDGKIESVSIFRPGWLGPEVYEDGVILERAQMRFDEYLSRIDSIRTEMENQSVLDEVTRERNRIEQGLKDLE
jgi:hypothetical protein